MLSSLDFENTGFFRLIKSNYLKDLTISFIRPDIELFGPVGPISYVRNSKAKIKIFITYEFTGFNTIDKQWLQYSSNLVDEVDMSLAFSRLDESLHKNYIRYPFWIVQHFGFLLNKTTTKDDIKKRVDEINNAQFEKTKFASLIASHDTSKLREKIFNEISKIDFVHSAGKLLKNDNTLKTNFANNKYEYLKQFKFNICPENAVSYGGVCD